MTVTTIHSPLHGALPLLVDEHPDRWGRGWRARLWPVPPRLAHVVAVFGMSEANVVEVMATTVESYDAHGLVPRSRVRSVGPA